MKNLGRIINYDVPVAQCYFSSMTAKIQEVYTKEQGDLFCKTIAVKIACEKMGYKASHIMVSADLSKVVSLELRKL